jgi:hypothetical protein
MSKLPIGINLVLWFLPTILAGGTQNYSYRRAAEGFTRIAFRAGR